MCSENEKRWLNTNTPSDSHCIWTSWSPYKKERHDSLLCRTKNRRHEIINNLRRSHQVTVGGGYMLRYMTFISFSIYMTNYQEDTNHDQEQREKMKNTTTSLHLPWPDNVHRPPFYFQLPQLALFCCFCFKTVLSDQVEHGIKCIFFFLQFR